jgi:hypothetical protein
MCGTLIPPASDISCAETGINYLKMDIFGIFAISLVWQKL